MKNTDEQLQDYCERCGEKLDPKTAVWLELSTHTGLFTDPEVALLPESESQGGFAFGKSCAAAVLKAGGQLTRIKKGRM